MTTYKGIKNNGSVKLFNARTYSDAYQQATDWAGDDGLNTFEEA